MQDTIEKFLCFQIFLKTVKRLITFVSYEPFMFLELKI